MTTLLQDKKHLHITDSTIRRLTFLLKGCGGSIYYGIIYSPPLKNIQEQYLYMESSDKLLSTHKTLTFHRQYYSVVDISFLWDGGGGQYSMV